MLHFNDIVVVSRILGKHRLPKTDFPSYTFEAIMPFEKAGVVGTYAFKAGDPFETYRMLFTANLRQPDVQPETMYRVHGYVRGIATAKNNNVYYNNRIIVTSMAMLSSIKLSFDPTTQILASGSSERGISNWNPEVYTIVPKDGEQNEQRDCGPQEEYPVCS